MFSSDYFVLSYTNECETATMMRHMLHMLSFVLLPALRTFYILVFKLLAVVSMLFV